MLATLPSMDFHAGGSTEVIDISDLADPTQGQPFAAWRESHAAYASNRMNALLRVPRVELRRIDRRHLRPVRQIPDGNMPHLVRRRKPLTIIRHADGIEHGGVIVWRDRLMIAERKTKFPRRHIPDSAVHVIGNADDLLPIRCGDDSANPAVMGRHTPYGLPPRDVPPDQPTIVRAADKLVTTACQASNVTRMAISREF
jgi:hypothetical protein